MSRPTRQEDDADALDETRGKAPKTGRIGKMTSKLKHKMGKSGGGGGGGRAALDDDVIRDSSQLLDANVGSAAVDNGERTLSKKQQKQLQRKVKQELKEQAKMRKTDDRSRKSRFPKLRVGKSDKSKGKRSQQQYKHEADADGSSSKAARSEHTRDDVRSMHADPVSIPSVTSPGNSSPIASPTETSLFSPPPTADPLVSSPRDFGAPESSAADELNRETSSSSTSTGSSHKRLSRSLALVKKHQSREKSTKKSTQPQPQPSSSPHNLHNTQNSNNKLFKRKNKSGAGKQMQQATKHSPVIGRPRAESVRHVVHVDANLEWCLPDSSTESEGQSRALYNRPAVNTPGGSQRHNISTHSTELFELIEPPIGSGAFGTVYRAFYRQSGIEMAIKVVNFPDMHGDAASPSVMSLEAEALRTEITSEMAILRQCSSPHVVQYWGNIWRGDSELWILMDFCQLGSLRDLMRVTNRESLSEPQIAHVMWSVLRGLAYLHQRLIIHFDLKSHNLLVNRRGEVKLADFGLAHQFGENQETTRAIAGTRYWMAPELLRRESLHKAGTAADMWSLGVTAIELATGAPPYFDEAPMTAVRYILQNDPPILQGKKWSKHFVSFLRAILCKEPADRAVASELIKSHPFITKASPRAFGELVHQWERVHAAANKNQSTKKKRLFKKSLKNRQQARSAHDQNEDKDEDEDEYLHSRPQHGSSLRRLENNDGKSSRSNRTRDESTPLMSEVVPDAAKNSEDGCCS